MDLSSILKDAGALPRECEPLLLVFHVPRSLPGGSVLLGSDGGTDLVVDSTSGFVISRDPRGEYPTRFMNSSVAQLGRCIDAYRVYVMRVKTTPNEDDQIRLVHELARQIRDIDETSVLSSENWWSIILEQAESGLL